MRGRLSAVETFRGRLAKVAPLVGERKWKFASVVAASAGAGLSEAAVLALVANVATAMAEGDASASVTLGPVSVEAGMRALLATAALVATLRLGLQLVIAYVPAHLGAEVQARLRQGVFDS